MNNSVIAKIFAGGIGAMWCYIEPTIPFILVCFLAMMFDVLSAWMLNRRVMRKYGREAADGKLKSQHAMKIISDLVTIFVCILLGDLVDDVLLPQLGDLHIAQYIAAVFSIIQLLSILENTSSCNDAPWAKVLQKFIADKTERHLEVALDALHEDKEDNQERN